MATDCRWRKKWVLFAQGSRQELGSDFEKEWVDPFICRYHREICNDLSYLCTHPCFIERTTIRLLLGPRFGFFFSTFLCTIKEYDRGNTCYGFFPLLNVRMYFIVTKVLHILFAFNVIISWNVHFVNNSVAFFCLSQKGLTTFTYFQPCFCL